LPRRVGEALNPNSDYHEWNALLNAAGVRDGRLHDARHTAATVLLVLGVPERTVMSIMGWSGTSMAGRSQHIPGSASTRDEWVSSVRSLRSLLDHLWLLPRSASGFQGLILEFCSLGGG
jgi:hypothetical protein